MGLILLDNIPNVGGFSNIKVGNGGGMNAVAPSNVPSIIQTGLVLYLDAGKSASYPGSGTTWSDLSGNGNNATLINAPTFTTVKGGEFNFNGSNTYASMGTVGFPTGTSAGTICAWGKTNITNNGFRWMFAYGKPSEGQARFVGHAFGKYWAGGYGQDIGDGIINTQWFHIASVWSGTQVSLYVNGSLISGPTTRLWNTDLNGNNGVVGRQVLGNNNAETWDGAISVVNLYNRALTAQEVLQNYNADSSRFI